VPRYSSLLPKNTQISGAHLAAFPELLFCGTSLPRTSPNLDLSFRDIAETDPGQTWTVFLGSFWCGSDEFDRNSRTMTMSHDNKIIEIRHLCWKVSSHALPAMTVIWLGLVGIGLSWMWEYEATPGEDSTTLAHWPVGSQIERNTDRPTLVVFAHPRCPCTRATIGELALIIAHCPERADVHVLFFKPSRFPAGWEKTDLWSSAEAIPGVQVACDEGGSEAKRFRATTSGSMVLYNSNGRLLFGGGITGSRGHSGDNVGRSAIESLLMNGVSDHKQTFVFGCSIRGRDDACVSEGQE
jgi:hypothetical protein